jgi:8-oxo-dGTP pyrophosphatase MutT (NUDIX family)
MARLPLNVRAILFDQQGRLVLIKRTRPGMPEYWVTPGGGVESSDADFQAALVRELMEELGAEVEIQHLAFEINQPDGKVKFFYQCKLLNMDLGRRCGPEFADPTRGKYEPEFICFHPDTLENLDIKPDGLKAYLIELASAPASC